MVGGRYAAMLAAGGEWHGQQIVPKAVIAQLRAGGDPSRMRAPVVTGDDGHTKSAARATEP